VTKLIVIDNYDSFTYNLVQMFMQYDLSIGVHRSDKVTVEDIGREQPDYLLISPGPRDPAHAGVSKALIHRFYQEIPILGVCLGMQCINEVFGGKTVRAPVPVHGKISLVDHQGQALFRGLPSPFQAARYHSLMTCKKGGDLMVTAKSSDGVVMGLSHPDFPLHGVQFHPESFMTEHGFALIENFLTLGPAKEPRRS
jgi:anthranilate synthase component 2